MAFIYYSDQEHADANEHLPKAIQAMQTGDLDRAATLLDAVLSRVPADYRYSFEDDEGNLRIKFWDQEDFMYYVTSQNPDRNILWISNAYGRAYFYRGFLCIRNNSPFEALQWLDKGIALEPEKPMFYLEKGKAFQMLQQPEAALEEYDHVLAKGDAVAPSPRALALRGRGFQLIELDRWDEAEQAFQESLRLVPDNEVALGELQYIEHLRAGGQKTFSEVAEAQTLSPQTCTVCGASLGENAPVFTMDGQLIFLCERCNREMEAATKKKWWQFWRR